MARPIPLLDLVFLLLDRAETPANVGVVMLFDPAPGRSCSQGAREIVRAFRAARPTPPFDCVPELPRLGLPHWRTVGDVDMKYHVRHEKLPPPGDGRQLRERVSELHRDPLDRVRPLFRLHVIEGLESGHLAVYLKSHHATWDGRSALARLFGTLPAKPGPLGTPFFALPQEAAGAAQSIDLAGLVRTLGTQLLALRELVGALQERRKRESSGEGWPAGNQPFGGPQTRLNRPVQADRAFAYFSLPLDEVRRVARAHDGKVNDVILAVVDVGVGDYLVRHKERPRERLVAMCPVSLREPGDHEATTKVATMFVPLGQPRSGAARRMREIVVNSAAAKREFHALSKDAALDYAALAFGFWYASHALGLDAYTRPVINLIVSNVGNLPGERFLGPYRLAGAYPISMIAEPAGLNVSAVSLGDRIDVGIVANRAAVPDADELARCCLAGWARLCKAARGASVKP
jgi:WS/DGAT/MGAT family acyltransferase